MWCQELRYVYHEISDIRYTEEKLVPEVFGVVIITESG